MPADEIAVAVTFLSGRYHGKEWPPSPVRLYQALLAGVMTGGYRALFPEVEPALRWLERQQTPTILAAKSRISAAYRIAVPNNDLDRVGIEWAAGREANPAQYRTLKTIEPRVVSGEGPHVVYQWRGNPEEIVLWMSLLQKATHCLHTFGWGVDMAFADLVSHEHRLPESRYSPSNDGSVNLDVPITGTLDDLQATYKRFLVRTSGKGVDTYTHPSMVDTRRYGVEGDRRNPVVRFRLLDADGERTKSVPWAHCMKVAGWLRHEAAEALREAGWPDDEIESYIQGHTTDGEKSRRVSYVPLPNVTGPYPDGRIRRVMMVEPATASGNAVRALERVMSGRLLTDESGNRSACLLPASRGVDLTFEQYVSSGQGWRTWRSATPVVLHGFNVQRRGVIDVNKTEKLLVRAFEMAGHSAASIDRLSFQAGPMWRGTGHASAMLLPQHLAKYPRLHVEVTFKSPIAGPVLAGLGRHYGIGVFAGASR
jgi:CRISPR-associated protein Csb2